MRRFANQTPYPFFKFVFFMALTKGMYEIKLKFNKTHKQGSLKL